MTDDRRLGRRLRRGRRRARSGPWNADAVAIATIVGLLVVVGLVMSFSASFVDAAQGGDPFGVFRRQAAWAGVGVVVFVIVAATDHRVWRPVAWVLMPLSMLGLALVLAPGVGLVEGGSSRWLAVGPVVVQPSEIAKFALLLWLADVHARKRENGLDLHARPSHLLVPALPALGIVGGLVLLEPDLGTALLLGLIVALVLWIEGVRLPTFAVLLGSGAALAAVAALAAPYRFARILGWWRPEADPLGSGYQLLQSVYALATGGWFGVGLGQSRGKWNFIPNPETDFVFAIIGEELGLVGAAVVLFMFVALLAIGLRVTRSAPDTFGRIVAFGVTGWIAGQAIVNVGAVTGLLPITGVTLPLVSVGGSSLVVTLTALALVVAVARSAVPVPEVSDRTEVAA